MSNGQHANGTPTADGWTKRIGQNTQRLRSSSDPALQQIRDLVCERGVDIASALVANLMPEDTNVISGFLVTANQRVFEFEYDWRRVQPHQGQLVVWRDISDTYLTRAFREPIAAAVAMAKHQESPAMAEQQ